MIYSKLEEKVEEVKEQLQTNIERRIDICEEYVASNTKRPFPCLFLNLGQDPLERKKVALMENTSARARLFAKLNRMVEPLKLLNPVSPYVSLGVGPGTLIPSFGLELDEALDYTPRGHKTVDEVLEQGMPSATDSGILPQIREDIETAKTYTSQFYKIEQPDMQGVFNIAHAVIGTDIFILPYTEPEKYSELMSIITQFFMDVDANLKSWIGEDRVINFSRRKSIIAECSCNLVSPSFYEEFILPYDLKICKYYGEVAIHPCSGPHVFYSTIRNIPNVVYTEAGKMLSPTAAGCISVEDALAEIGDRTISLCIGQELPEGKEFELISNDFDQAKKNNRLLFGYTGTHFRRDDIPHILDMHRRLDDYWTKNIWENK